MKPIAAITAAVALLSAPADAFWRMRCPGQVVFTRLDPLVQPGEMSRHPHAFVGGSSVSDTVTYESLTSANCTTCEVSADKSLYWVPALMFNNSGPIVPAQQDDFAVYYQLYPKPNEPLTSFPPGFRMLAGDPLLRSNQSKDVPGSDKWNTHQKEQFARQIKSTGFNCIKYDGSNPEPTAFRQFLPSKAFIDTCSQLRVEQYFPSCWNGKDLDSPDHRSHMAYPEQINNGKCPDSHPKRTPVLLYETYWDVSKFRSKAGEFLLSNGDPTGWGMHGDFIMGWDNKVLTQAVKECLDLSGDVRKCPAFANVLQDVSPKFVDGKQEPQCSAQSSRVVAKVATGNTANENCASGANTICGDVPVQRGPKYATIYGGNANKPAPSASLKGPDAAQPSGLPKVPDAAKPSVTPSGTPKASEAPKALQPSTSTKPAAVAPAPSPKPPAPTSVAVSKDEGSFVSTQTRRYTTTGGVVVLELVAIKEVVTYTTVTVAAKHRRHMHHMHQRREFEHGLLGRA